MGRFAGLAAVMALALMLIAAAPAAAAEHDAATQPGAEAAADPAADDTSGAAPGEEAAEAVTEPAPPTPAHVPKPKRKAANVKVSLKGLGGRKLRFGRRVTAVAKLRPKLAGEPLRFTLKRGKKVVGRRTVTIGESGKASWRTRPYKPGAYRIKAQHPRSSRMGPAKGTSKSFGIAYSSLAQGNFGSDVAIFNRRLRKLAFVTGKGRSFSAATGRAVLAYRKANGMARTQFASVKLIKRVLRGKGGVKLRHPNAGRHVEADISRQILILADKGKPVEIYHTSSGASSTPTVLGKYRFYMKQPGTNNVGMVHSSYFIRGYAIHGYRSVPTYPASHGCLRVPIPDALHIYNWVDIGMQIFTYR